MQTCTDPCANAINMIWTTSAISLPLLSTIHVAKSDVNTCFQLHFLSSDQDRHKRGRGDRVQRQTRRQLIVRFLFFLKKIVAIGFLA
jgi:hypothetical protein